VYIGYLGLPFAIFLAGTIQAVISKLIIGLETTGWWNFSYYHYVKFDKSYHFKLLYLNDDFWGYSRKRKYRYIMKKAKSLQFDYVD
jgi:hypothetical protein